MPDHQLKAKTPSSSANYNCYPKQRQPDIALAKAKLGWEPKVNLEDGLKETIAYFKALLANK